MILRQGSQPKCTRIGFQLGPDDDLDAFEKQTAAHGRADVAQEGSRAHDRRHGRIRGSEGHRHGGVQAAGAADARVFAAPASFRTSSGHVAFHVTDVKAVTSFYCDVLGFRVSDWMGDYFSFLRCGVDHHTINLVETGSNKHFHTAFELRDWAHMQSACDFLSRNGYKILWGPGRHGIGHNLFTYHRSPNGLITELFAELDQMKDEALGYFDPRPWHRDNPQRPKTWPKTPDAANLWGPMPPDEMMQ